jgi:L-amino acid N-acyltransferase YncA
MIRAARTNDATAIAEIYNHYVRHTVVTFEEVPVAVKEMAQRILDVSERLPWLVWEDGGAVVGWAYATAWKPRSAYRFSVETTVYVAASHQRRGVGDALYRKLIEDLRARKLHSAVGGIALPNEGSVALHEKLGFKKVAHFAEVGRKLDRWIDVAYWQLIL